MVEVVNSVVNEMSENQLHYSLNEFLLSYLSYDNKLQKLINKFNDIYKISSVKDKIMPSKTYLWRAFIMSKELIE